MDDNSSAKFKSLSKQRALSLFLSHLWHAWLTGTRSNTVTQGTSRAINAIYCNNTSNTAMQDTTGPRHATYIPPDPTLIYRVSVDLSMLNIFLKHTALLHRALTEASRLYYTNKSRRAIQGTIGPSNAKYRYNQHCYIGHQQIP